MNESWTMKIKEESRIIDAAIIFLDVLQIQEKMLKKSKQFEELNME
jgi:hypothetical protein